jgi:hydroxyacylglutathione hydrolase
LYLALILNTHHHSDHVAGNAKLQQEFGAPVIGPSKEAHPIEGLSRGVEEGAVVTFSDIKGRVLSIPGHTAGHVAYYFPELKALFCGDTLFSLGCGKLLEGTSADLWGSLVKLRALPDDTMIYAGHENTERNAKFALALDGKNPDLLKRAEEVAALRKKGKPTLPVSLAQEKKTNPFLRIDDPDFKLLLNKKGFPALDADPAAMFGALRSAKDQFDSGQKGGL